MCDQVVKTYNRVTQNFKIGATSPERSRGTKCLVLSLIVNIAKYKYSLYLGGRHRSWGSFHNFDVLYMCEICHNLKREREAHESNLVPNT